MREFIFSSIGRKYLMGMTGLVWVGFVFAHMAGNLLMFVGPDVYNSYGHAIVSGGFIYIAEAVLIISLLVHVLCGLTLALENKKARPVAYAAFNKGEKRAALSSRTMAGTGSLILAFIILHIATFKYGPHYDTTVNGVVMRDLYKLLVEVFSQPVYVGWYLVCLVLLGLHLRHGVASIFQSLGILNKRTQSGIRVFANVYSFVVALGFLSQPLVLFFKG